LCGVGVAGILIVPTARVWGKRHLFLLGHVLMIVSCIWAGASGKNKNSLLWARVFQGVALAPFEALVNACVGDLYFVHVSGFWDVGVVMNAWDGTDDDVGTRQTNGRFECRASLPLMFFFVPETAFRRPEHLNTDFKSRGGQGESSESRVSLSGDETKELRPGSNVVTVETAMPVPEKDSFVKSLRLFNGRKTDESFFKLLLRPFPLFFHPGILWVSAV